MLDYLDNWLAIAEIWIFYEYNMQDKLFEEKNIQYYCTKNAFATRVQLMNAILLSVQTYCAQNVVYFA